MTARYRVGAASVRDAVLDEFLACCPVPPDLERVPGVGPTVGALLRADGVETSYQLVGRFLALRSAAMSTQQHMDAACEWLRGLGIFRDCTVARTVARVADKWVPGLYADEDCAQ